MVVLYPYVGQTLDESEFLRILWAIIPLTAVHACGSNRRLLTVAIVFALIIIVSMLLGIGRPVGVMQHISAFLAVLFYIFIAFVLINHVWRAKTVDADTGSNEPWRPSGRKVVHQRRSSQCGPVAVPVRRIIIQ